MFARPPGIMKHKMFLAIQKHRSAGNQISKAMECVDSALTTSSNQRNNAAAMEMRMKLTGKAGLSGAAKQAAYRKLLEKVTLGSGGGRQADDSSAGGSPPDCDSGAENGIDENDRGGMEVDSRAFEFKLSGEGVKLTFEWYLDG